MSRWEHDAGTCQPDTCTWCHEPPHRPTPEAMTELRRLAREGADRLHATTTPLDRRHQPTRTEELARARARADREVNR